ncbi:unnamed protein product [Lymnaea stagnalis]|uniref:VWFA domain-containing protein n=1 Tax=Lymnaea stagnalis TaxID=6523 RepID=A0AAV2I6U4_LYMST
MCFLSLFTFVTLCCSLGLGDSENATQGCHMAKLDLVIIVDSSASVGSGNFTKIVKFILDLVKPLPVHSEGIRVALVRYSSTAQVISYLGNDMNQLEKSAALGSMKYKAGATRTDLGIALTRNEVLIPARGDRPDVPDQVILLTDGESTIKAATRAETTLLKKRPGLKIIVLGIGERLDDKELLEIATSPELKHVVTNFSNLSGMLKDLESATCEDRTKSVTHEPVLEVSTPPERETVVQLKNVNSQTSVDDNYLLRPSSSIQESSHPSEPSLTRQFDTTNSNVASYSIPLSGVHNTSSDDFIYPSGTLPDMSSSLAGTPSFHPGTSESSASSSSAFYKLNDGQSTSEIIEESILIFGISSQSGIQLQATTTRRVDDQTSVLSIVAAEIQLTPSNVLPSTPLSSDVSITDFHYDGLVSSVISSDVSITDIHYDGLVSSVISSDVSITDIHYDGLVSSVISSDVSITDIHYDGLVSSAIDNTFPSTRAIPVFDAVSSLDTMTSSTPSPPLTPLLLSLLIPSSDAFLDSSTTTLSFVLSPMNASSFWSITPTSTMPFSLQHSISYSPPLSSVSSSSDDSISYSLPLSSVSSSSDDSISYSPPLSSVSSSSDDSISYSLPLSSVSSSSDDSISYSLPLSFVSSPSYDSISRNSINNIMPTFTTEYKRTQSHIFKTENSESIFLTYHSVFVNMSINSSSVASGNSKTGGDISSDFVYIYVGGGIVVLVILLCTSIILARIFRRENEDGDEAS